MKWVYFVSVISVTAVNTVVNADDQLENTSLTDILVQALDKNSDGKITKGDLEDYGGLDGDLEDLGWRLEDVPLEAIIRKLDKNNDKAVDHTDLEIDVKKLSNAIVSMLDFDNNGYLTKDEAIHYNDVLLATTVKGLELYLVFWFDLADLNSDGIISDSDFPKLAPFQKLKSFLTKDNSFIGSKMLKSIDVNGDYQISKTELTQLLTKMAKKVDMNDDGTVTFQEILQSMVWFDLIDLNDDEFISEDDFPELSPFQTIKMLIMHSKLASVLIEAIDVNQDDQISKTESTQFLTETIDRLDQNDDGTVWFKEVLETMEQFKFPKKFIQQNEQDRDTSTKVINLFFDNFDEDADGKISGDELSNVFTKPIPSSFVEEIQESYAIPPHAYEEGTSQQDMKALFESVSSFLRSPSSAVSIKISFALTCFVFIDSYLMN